MLRSVVFWMAMSAASTGEAQKSVERSTIAPRGGRDSTVAAAPERFREIRLWFLRNLLHGQYISKGSFAEPSYARKANRGVRTLRLGHFPGFLLFQARGLCR